MDSCFTEALKKLTYWPSNITLVTLTAKWSYIIKQEWNLHWWISNVTFTSKPLRYPKPTIEIRSHASGKGWGPQTWQTVPEVDGIIMNCSLLEKKWIIWRLFLHSWDFNAFAKKPSQCACIVANCGTFQSYYYYCYIFNICLLRFTTKYKENLNHS